MPREILDVLVFSVDYLCELSAIHHFLKHPHVDSLVKPGVLGHIGTNDFGYSRAPVESIDQKPRGYPPKYAVEGWP